MAAGIWPLRPAVAGLGPFSAPEELLGQRPTPESDVYGLAATLVYWLTTEFPHGGTTPEEAMERARDGAAPVDVRERRPDVPPMLASAMTHALVTDPRLRHGSVAALGTLLAETHRRLQAEVPVGFETGVHLLPAGAMGNVRILGRHGSGAFGVVFRARAEEGGDLLAVKALKPEHRHDEEARTRFLREAQALHEISHPNVVRIRAVGEAGGTPFAVMEFIPGPDLGTLLLKEGTIPHARAARLASGVARGLEAIHREGILHRDLKPHNILVAPGDRPVIADFGVARSLHAERMTMTGQFLGTPAYMAPEQFEDASPTFAVDLYALGAILHEMLSGSPPFSGKDALSTIRAIRERPPPPLSSEVPGPLRDLVSRLLGKDPEKRPSDAGPVAAELDALLVEQDPLRAHLAVDEPARVEVGERVGDLAPVARRLRERHRALFLHALARGRRAAVLLHAPQVTVRLHHVDRPEDARVGERRGVAHLAEERLARFVGAQRVEREAAQEDRVAEDRVPRAKERARAAREELLLDRVLLDAVRRDGHVSRGG